MPITTATTAPVNHCTTRSLQPAGCPRGCHWGKGGPATLENMIPYYTWCYLFSRTLNSREMFWHVMSDLEGWNWCFLVFPKICTHTFNIPCNHASPSRQSNEVLPTLFQNLPSLWLDRHTESTCFVQIAHWMCPVQVRGEGQSHASQAWRSPGSWFQTSSTSICRWSK